MRILLFLALALSHGIIIASDDLSATIQTLHSAIQAPTTLPTAVAAQLPSDAQKMSSALDKRSQIVDVAKQALDNAQTPEEKTAAQQQLLTAQQTSPVVAQAIIQKVDQLTPEERNAYAQAQAAFSNE